MKKNLKDYKRWWDNYQILTFKVETHRLRTFCKFQRVETAQSFVTELEKKNLDYNYFAYGDSWVLGGVGHRKTDQTRLW